MHSSTSIAAVRQRVLDYLDSISGKKILVGVENKRGRTPSSDTDRIAAITGRVPTFWGADFGFGSYAVDARPTIVAEAIKQWNAGAVVGLMYHACAPTMDELCRWDDIGGAAPVHLTDAQWNELVTPGSQLYKAWTGRLDTLSVYFQELQAGGVVVLFRPFHEMNQCKFWWGCHAGPNGTARLYQITHDYLVQTKGLNNIIWVWDVQDFPTLATDVDTYNPGPTYFDVAALDFYGTGYTLENYRAMLRVAADKPIAIGECQYMPTPKLISEQPRWVYAMLWPDFIQQNLETLPILFKAPNVLTLSQMPGWH